MRRPAEAVESDRGARLDLRALDRAVTDNPRAEQRRDSLVRDPRRQRIREMLAHRRELRVSAVAIPSRETGVGTKILGVAQAVLAAPAGLAQPRDPDPLPDPEARTRRPRFFDHADDLMARNDPLMLRRQVALGDVQIGAANPAGANPDENLVGRGTRPFLLDQARADWSRSRRGSRPRTRACVIPRRSGALARGAHRPVIVRHLERGGGPFKAFEHHQFARPGQFARMRHDLPRRAPDA